MSINSTVLPETILVENTEDTDEISGEDKDSSRNSERGFEVVNFALLPGNYQPSGGLNSRIFDMRADLENAMFEYRDVNRPLIEDEDKLKRILDISGDYLKYACSKLRDDEKIVELAFKADNESFKYASDRLRKDRDFIVKIVAHPDDILIDLTDDEEYVLAVCSSWPDSPITYISERLSNSEVFLRKCILCGCNVMESIPWAADNKNLVLIALSEGIHFRHASERLRGDKELAIEAVKIAYWNLSYCSDELRDDEDVVSAAIMQNGLALEDASERLRGHRRTVIKSFSSCFRLKHVGEHLKDDEDLVLKAIKIDSNVYIEISDRLRDSKKFALEALEANCDTFRVFSSRLTDDKIIALKAIEYNYENVRFVSERLKKDRDFIYAAIKHNPRVIEYLGAVDKPMAIEALKINSVVFCKLSKDLQEDMEIQQYMVSAERNSRQMIRHMPIDIKISFVAC